MGLTNLQISSTKSHGSFIAPCRLCLKTLYARNGNCRASFKLAGWEPTIPNPLPWVLLRTPGLLAHQSDHSRTLFGIWCFDIV